MNEDEYWLIVNAITSISFNFRRTVEVIVCLNTYNSYPEFVISKPVHFCTDLLQFIFQRQIIFTQYYNNTTSEINLSLSLFETVSNNEKVVYKGYDRNAK